MKKVAFVVVAILGLWCAWSWIGRAYDHLPLSDSRASLQQFGTDSLCGRNIVGIQPYMVPSDYLSEERFHQKLQAYFLQARDAGYFRERTVVVLPEYVGTWLVIAGEKAAVAEAHTVTGAMALMVASNPLRTLRSVFRHQDETDRVAAAIFRMQSAHMVQVYQQVFARLARDFGVTINAGSIVLPGPHVTGGKIEVDASAPLYNTTFIFHPTGAVDSAHVRKSFPITTEAPFIRASPLDALPVFELPIGKTCLLVCADSWYPESYARVNALGAEIILVNSYLAGNEAMRAPWQGYNGAPMPSDVDPSHVGTFTEQDAWIAHALPGRIKSTGARIGVNVFLRGQLWDLGTDGQPFFVKDGVLLPTAAAETAGIWNLCF